MKYLIFMASIVMSVNAAEPAVQADAKVVVVVNTANSVRSISKTELSRIFLKRVTKWDNRAPKSTIMPVDRDKASKLRDAFARAVHGMSSASLNSYWQTQIFSGKAIPPTVKASDEQVLEFVRANENAIGYVSASAPLGKNVKIVEVGRL